MTARWDAKWVDLACYVARRWSKDASTKVGAVIVEPERQVIVSTGYNGFPRAISEHEPERHERPLKYLYTVHAERNAIYNSQLADLRDCTLYLSWCPVNGICADCAQAIIQVGIKRVVGPLIPFPGKGTHWAESCQVGTTMLFEAGVALVQHVVPRVTTPTWTSALTAVQLAYRKHHLSDERIGWEELSTVLCDALCNEMGDAAFQRWLAEQSKHE